MMKRLMIPVIRQNKLMTLSTCFLNQPFVLLKGLDKDFIMHVHLKLLANYKNQLPPDTYGNQITILVPEGSFPETILKLYSIPPIPESVILINGKTLCPDEPLQEDDVICAFPAMAGG